MSEYKINIPRLKLLKKFAKSPAKYLRKIVIDNAEGRGLLTPENREEYLQRIDHEIAVFERGGIYRLCKPHGCGHRYEVRWQTQLRGGNFDRRPHTGRCCS